MKVIEFSGHQLAAGGVYDVRLGMTQAEINASLSAGSAIAQPEALWPVIAPTEQSRTAAKTHTAGSYFITDGKLYRATLDIPAGGVITPGANAAQTTVLEAVRDMLQLVRYTGGSPRCDQVTSFDWGEVEQRLSWTTLADNALQISDNDVFG